MSSINKVAPGQPLNIPASAYNAFVDVAQAHRSGTFRDRPLELSKYDLQPWKPVVWTVYDTNTSDYKSYLYFPEGSFLEKRGSLMKVWSTLQAYASFWITNSDTQWDLSVDGPYFYLKLTCSTSGAPEPGFFFIVSAEIVASAVELNEFELPSSSTKILNILLTKASAETHNGITTWKALRLIQGTFTIVPGRDSSIVAGDPQGYMPYGDCGDLLVFDGSSWVSFNPNGTEYRKIISLLEDSDSCVRPVYVPLFDRWWQPPVIVAPFDGANPENVTSKTLSAAVYDRYGGVIAPPANPGWHTLICSIPVTAGAGSDVYSNFISTAGSISWSYSLGQLGPEQDIAAGAFYFTHAWVRFDENQEVIDYLILYPCVTYLPHKTTTEVTVVTDYRVDTANRKLQKKTRSIRVVATGSESDWLDVHTGSECV